MKLMLLAWAMIILMSGMLLPMLVKAPLPTRDPSSPLLPTAVRWSD